MRRYLLLLILLLALPFSARAQDVSVSGTVPTQVDLTTSTLTISPSSILADGKTISVATVTLYKNTDQSVMPDITVTLSSNRGVIDTIKAYEAGVLTSSATVATNSDGVATFAIWSSTAGQATLSAVVDNNDDSLAQTASLTVTALPVITQVTVTVDIPGVGTVTVLKPKTTKTTTSTPATTETTDGDSETAKPDTTATTTAVVDTGINLSFSFWQLLLIILLILILPTALIAIGWLMKRLNRLRKEVLSYQTQEKAMLEKIFQQEQKLTGYESYLAQGQEKIEAKLDQINTDLAKNKPTATENAALSNPVATDRTDTLV